MEVLRLGGGRPPHRPQLQDVPIDLSTSGRPTLLLRPPWPSLPDPPDLTPEPTPAPPRYIPIPKKRHCHSSPTTMLTPTPPARCSPAADPRSSPEVARKRPRLESPPPPDSYSCEDGVEVASSTSGGGGAGAGRAGNGGGTTGGAGNQSEMRRRGSQRWPPCPGAVPGGHLLAALLRLQNQAAHTSPTPAVKDTGALMSAVQQSQILYYTYCSQLLHALAAQQHNEDLAHQDTKNSQDTHAAQDTLSSILRARLHTQEPSPAPPVPAAHPPATVTVPLPQLSTEPRPASTDSHTGSLPSSTTGGLEDLDLSPSEASGGARRRAPRALTGKHVRPGTGASATTLITLRQKLQERQKYREVYGGDPPHQPAKSNKGKSKKR